MNLRRLFNFKKDSPSQPDPEQEPIWRKGYDDSFDPSQYNFTPDELGQSRYRLGYPRHSPHGAHSEEYETALQIAEEFYQLYEQDAKMAYWDAHYTVFGLAGCIVFDTQENNYGPLHGISQDDLDDTRADKRYQVFDMYPNDVGEVG